MPGRWRPGPTPGHPETVRVTSAPSVLYARAPRAYDAAMTVARVVVSIAFALLSGIAAPARAATADAVAPPLVRVMTYNLRYAGGDSGENAWENRRGFLLETIRAFDPDLLGTQECLGLQAAFLRDSLPGYGFVGVGRDDGKLAGEMCAVFWKKSAFRKAGEGHFWLSETPDVPGSVGWDAALTRMATWVQLVPLADTTCALTFVDTHFDHVGEEARRQSSRVLRERIGAIAGCGGNRIVVVGDFNSPAQPDAGSPYGVLVSLDARRIPTRFDDAYRALHEPSRDEATYHGYSGATAGERIDWILTSPDLDAVASEIVRTSRDGRYPSDHFPVSAVIRLSPIQP